MADVVNSISASPQGRTNSYVTSPCSSNNTLVSPKIVEAIDRIFPKSPSQLLPHSLSESLNGKRSPSTSVNTSSPQSNMISTMPCTTSMAYLTTDTTTTATAVFTGLTTSSGTKSPLMSSTPASHMDLPSAPAQTTISQTPPQKHKTTDTNTKNSGVQKEGIPVKRISRADLEIMNSLSFDQTMKNGRAARNTERESSDSQSRELSDSDDMCRPFIALKKDKKKKKRKHLKLSEERKDKTLEEVSQDLESSSSLPKTSKHVTTLGQSTEDDVHILSHGQSAMNTSGAGSNNLDVSNSAMDLSVDKKLLPVFESFSNLTPAVPPSDDKISVDENVSPKKRTHRQKLPKSRRHKYHIIRDFRYIKKFFPPCFAVLRKIDHLVLGGSGAGHSFAFDLSLKERVKMLSSLCAENKIECESKEKAINDILNYKNVLDDSQCNNSEDEFRPQGRSLRKRRQDICYAEPTEDDLLEDLALSSRKKNSGQSKKNSPLKKDLVDEKDHSLTNDNQSSKDLSTKKKEKAQPSSTAISLPSVGERESVIVSEVSAGKDKKSSLKSHHESAAIPRSLNSDAYKSSNVSQSTSKAASGPNLVYVFPKTCISNTRTQASSSSDQSSSLSSSAKEKATTKTSSIRGSKPGPASKTNRPMNIPSFAPVTTLSMPISTKSPNAVPIPLGLSGSMLASSSLPQNLPIQFANTNLSSLNQRNNNMASNLCMVKIDGKDYLLSMPPSNNILSPPSSSLNSTITPAAPLSQTSLLSAAGSRYMLYQPNSGTVPSIRPSAISQGSVTTKVLTQTLPVPHLTTAVTLPGRLPSPAIHLLPTSVSQSSILTAPVPGNTRISSSITSVAISSSQSLFLTSSSLARPATSVLRTVSTIPSTSAGGLFASSQTSSSVTVTTSGARNIRSYLAPLAAPGSTVIPRNTGLTTASSSTVQLVAPNPSVTGARCFRIIVPACSATGSSARIATLGTSALSSPLTRLSASSTLLPQRKHSLDKDMSPEKRAAKRRRLEKKYPLPPGVVIKTEPLDTPQSSSVVQSGSVRSLLSGQNIQLIAAASSRSGVPGVQRFRIISPNASGVVVGSRPVRVSSNVIIRAPIISQPSSRVLSPPSSGTTTLASFSSLSASSTTTLSSSTTLISQAASSGVTVSTAALSVRKSTAATTTTTTITSVSTSVTSVGRGTISLLSPGTLLLSSSSVATSSTPPSNIDTSAISSSTADTTVSSFTTPVVPAQPSSEPKDSVSTAVSRTATSTSASSESQRGQSASDSSVSVTVTSQRENQATDNSGPVAEVEALKQNIESLQKLISKQETLGLKGARLDKLKEILNLKRNLLLDLQLSQELETSQSNSNSNEDQARTVNNGATEDDPLIID